MATPNPMQNTYPPPQPTVSSKSFTVTGITTTVYGIEELPLDCEEVVCIWLLHPRLQTQSCMRPAGASAIHRWNNELQKMKLPGHRLGLLAVSFDQRNHGSREVNRLANETWRSGNKSHAQDMLGTYRSQDTLCIIPSALIISRWYCNGCLPSDDPSFILCLSRQ